uniref:Family with sequence similarity 53 member B n=1 Tax=Equus caballus TaxID=9796 RepID=F7CEJ2_HORSE
MVMILSKSLDKQGADSIACRTFNPELHTPKKMSQGPTLFSCGIMENDRWRDLDRKCPLQIDQPSASIWECLPEKCQDSTLWHREAATACAVTNLIKDLSLNDHNGNPSAPPSKRQCRSLSFSDEMSSCRTSWRPLGSKVWTPVEKRRCYSGGSVQRYSNGFSTMQRSSSFSLPSRANVLSSPYDQAGFHHRFGGQPCQGVPGSATCGQAGDPAAPHGGTLSRSQHGSHGPRTAVADKAASWFGSLAPVSLWDISHPAWHLWHFRQDWPLCANPGFQPAGLVGRPGLRSIQWCQGPSWPPAQVQFWGVGPTAPFTQFYSVPSLPHLPASGSGRFGRRFLL